MKNGDFLSRNMGIEVFNMVVLRWFSYWTWKLKIWIIDKTHTYGCLFPTGPLMGSDWFWFVDIWITHTFFLLSMSIDIIQWYTKHIDYNSHYSLRFPNKSEHICFRNGIRIRVQRYPNWGPVSGLSVRNGRGLVDDPMITCGCTNNLCTIFIGINDIGIFIIIYRWSPNFCCWNLSFFPYKLTVCYGSHGPNRNRWFSH